MGTELGVASNPNPLLPLRRFENGSHRADTSSPRKKKAKRSDLLQASSLETTSPSTSVRRKSLPMWR